MTDYKDTPYGKAGVPQFPAHPPTVGTVDLHACMGLNSCKGQDRFGPDGHPDPKVPGRSVVNDCAGQGYCSTTPDHTCHVLNNCRGQGGCGLYGTAEEMSNPGNNDCKSLGSCATPINSSRFGTNGENTRESVWHRARKVFLAKKWQSIAEPRGLDPDVLPAVPHAALFSDGPAYDWVTDSNAGMTACGSSGMSGASSCA